MDPIAAVVPRWRYIAEWTLFWFSVGIAAGATWWETRHPGHQSRRATTQRAQEIRSLAWATAGA